MLRLVFFFSFVFLWWPLLAQDTTLLLPKYFDQETGKIEFKEVVTVPGSKDELYKRAVYWLNGYYKDPTRITMVRDAHTGKIVGRHYLKIYKDPETGNKTYAGKVYYTFVIRFKDGKYQWLLEKLELVSKERMELTDWFDLKNPDYKKEWGVYLNQLLAFVEKWSQNLKEKMQPSEQDKKDDDW